MSKGHITVKLVGGLGNQLFGLVFGLAVANKLQSKLVADCSLISMGNNNSRKLEIRSLNISGIPVIFKKSFLSKLIENIDSQILKSLYWKTSIYFTKQESKFNKSEFKRNQKLSGYFHTWIYADALIKEGFDLNFDTSEFSGKYFQIINKFKATENISIHVRVGDYLNFPKVYKILPEIYFLEAIRKLTSQNLSRKVYVFVENSDDLINFYPNLYKKANFIIDNNSGLSSIESFNIICQSKCIVASNSSYSLWAAWFIKKNNGYAIVPDASFFPQESKNLLDQRWDRID